MQTNLSQSIDITANKAKYDESVKELFADKQVLAWILKYTLEEFGDDEIPEIIIDLSVIRSRKLLLLKKEKWMLFKNGGQWTAVFLR